MWECECPNHWEIIYETFAWDTVAEYVELIVLSLRNLIKVL